MLNIEKETIITFNEAEPSASVYTCNKALTNKLNQLAQDHPEDCRREEVFADGSSCFSIPKRWIRIHPTRKITDAQRMQLIEARKKACFARKITGLAVESQHETQS